MNAVPGEAFRLCFCPGLAIHGEALTGRMHVKCMRHSSGSPSMASFRYHAHPGQHWQAGKP